MYDLDSSHSMPTNLLLIVAVQAAAFAVAALSLRGTSAWQRLDWPVAIGVGVGFGILMDLVLGEHGVFAYLPNADRGAVVSPKELPVLVLLFNSVASYGLASLSVALIAPNLVVSFTRTRDWSIRLATATTLSLFAVLTAPERGLAMLFAWGAVIVSAGELWLYLCGKTGPVLALLAGKDPMPILRLTLFSSVLGVCYELANFFFPFWVWLPGSDITPIRLSSLVALVGYIALFHPMAVLYVSVSARSRMP